MTDHRTPAQDVRRARRAAIAGVGVAALVGGLVATATPATAATTPVAPTLTLGTPAQIANDGSTPAAFTVGIDNSATGTINLQGKQLQMILTLPGGLGCSAVNGGGSLSATGTGPTLALASAATASTCHYTYTFGASDVTASGTATDKATYTYDVTIDGSSSTAPPVTGTVGSSVEVDTLSGGTFQSVFAGPVTGSSNGVVNQAAVFDGKTPPAARMARAYSYKLITTPAFPATSTTYKAIGYQKNADGTWNATPTTRTAQNVTVGGATHGLIDLSDSASAASGFYLDTTTGTIDYGTVSSGTFTAGAPSAVNQPPVYTWTVVANNGVGGAGTAMAANPPRPLITGGDVDSVQFTLPILFTDVNTTSPFASEIYTLAADGVVAGYATGAYGVRLPVSRQAFAAYTVRLLNDIKGATTTPATVNGVTLNSGPCPASSGTPFWDVSASNPFCQDIKALASLGITTGYKDGSFKPTAPIERQAIAAFFFRLQSAVDGQTIGDAPLGSTGFSDVSPKNPFSGDIKWMVDNKITTGYSDGTFRPARATSRQANAAFLLRLGQLNKLFG